jgi:putative ABC transport system permease protein
MLLKLAWHSAANRKLSLIISIVSIAVSVMLLGSVDILRKEVKHSFLSSVSGADLIVGARSGSINLLLYSIFHIGLPTNNISWKNYQKIAKMPKVAWSIPLSLGDSMRGFRVIGTTEAMFRHYRYGRGQTLRFQEGAAFVDLYDAVLGHETANRLGLKLGDKIVLTHGTGKVGAADHDDKPFVISGILAPSATPMDNAVLVSLQAIEAIHLNWKTGVRMPLALSAENTRAMELIPETITAAIIGLQERIHTFRLQRHINKTSDEALSAIIPGATLAELWRIASGFEQILLIIAVCVLIAGLIGMLTTILAGLNERRREMALLRAMGARPGFILRLFVIEGVAMMLMGLVLGALVLYAVLTWAQPWIFQHFGVAIQVSMPDSQQWGMIGLALGLSVVFSLIPGILAYTRSLHDGITITE